MNIITKFNLGDYVWPIIFTSEESSQVCKICQGEGGIKVKGNKFQCLKCYGTGIGKSEFKNLYKVYEPSIIGKIIIELYDHSKRSCYDRPDERKYMLKSTGVGSGTLWHEDKLFKSEEEAQQECDRLNKLQEKK